MIYKGKVIENPVTGQIIRFVVTARESDGEKVEVEVVFPRSTIQPPSHSHPRQHTCFEVTQGELHVRLEEGERVLKKGEVLRLLPGQPHTFWNAADLPTVVRWTATPALRSEEFLTAIFQLAQDGQVSAAGNPSLLQSALLMQEFREELQLSAPMYGLWGTLFALLRPIARITGLQKVPQH
ncbi:cupin domain-containing protein [Hymenobacter sp. BT730]|uniref:cupin domain-containing protein n=1 Tax=Hymenobacter sp. BT730 TaxID=3063332 RepID=UPI0026E0FE4E|nr:cupin domain-containing protein [Hymenobacter sp. BT730]